MTLPCKGLLFDVDGTLVDNMMVHHRAWQQYLRKLGLDYSIERVKAEIHGVNLEILERLFGDRYTLEERRQLAWDKEAAYRDIFAPEFEDNVVAGTREFIRQAAGLEVPMAVGTAGPFENAFFAIDRLGIREHLGHVVHSGMVARGKPDPEVYRQAADGIHVELKDCIVFEDSVTGAKAGINAGCPVVVLTTTHAEEEFGGLNVVNFRRDFTGLRLEKAEDGYLLHL